MPRGASASYKQATTRRRSRYVNGRRVWSSRPVAASYDIMQAARGCGEKMEAADSTQAKDAYIAAMGCDGAIRKHAKKVCCIDTLPAFVATLQ